MKYKVGMKVRFNNSDKHEIFPAYYPKVGTIGKIVIDREYNCLVQWPKNSTSDDDCWYCQYDYLDIVEEDKEMTDKEIWNMLKNKMDKNGIRPSIYTPHRIGTVLGSNFLYSKEMLIKAISLAYRCGYGRGSKGRPFKYNIKPKVKPNTYVINENGDKIYYCDDEVKIGDKVVFISHDGSKNNVWPEYGRVGKVIENADPDGRGLWVIWEGRNNKNHNWREYCKKVVE